MTSRYHNEHMRRQTRKVDAYDDMLATEDPADVQRELDQEREDRIDSWRQRREAERIGLDRVDEEVDAWLENTEEYVMKIVTPAVWFNDGREHNDEYAETGLVFTGFNHVDCVTSAYNQSVLGGSKGLSRILLKAVRTEGFITSDNTFVDRHKAYDIAERAGQVKEHVSGRNLYSYNLRMGERDE